jgi:nucleotide-binding universal stress UspA family protein
VELSPGYAEAQARKLLEQQVEGTRAAGGTVTEVHLRMGQPAQEIIALSEELGTDLLVVGSGGPHQIRRAVAATMRRAALGRVSDVIVRSAPCPVLIMRGGRVQSSANL